MILARVTGDVVSTIKNEKYRGFRQLLAQPVELDAKTPLGPSFLVLDLVGAGEGDLVLILKEGGGVRILLQDETIPLAAVITAIVDELELAPEASLVGSSVLETNRAALAQANAQSDSGEGVEA